MTGLERLALLLVIFVAASLFGLWVGSFVVESLGDGLDSVLLVESDDPLMRS